MPYNSDSSGNSFGYSSKRGFAAMSEIQQRYIASLGGKAAHASGNAHEFSSEEARIAGRKGGEARSHNQHDKSAR